MAPRFRTWLVGAALLVLAGCGGQDQQTPVWIGHISPLSGPDRAAGQGARKGIRLAVDEANQHPDDQGPGRPVRVLHTDTHGDPRAFGAQATRLVTVNKVTALLGGHSAADVKEFKRLDRAGLFLIAPVGLPGESLSDSRVFFTGLTAADRGRALARFAAAKGFRRVIVLADADEPSGQAWALAEAFAESFPEFWGKEHPRTRPVLVGPRRYGKDNPIRERARRLKQERGGKCPERRPIAVLVAGQPGDVRRLREELGQQVPVLFGGAEGQLRDLLDEPETSSGVYLATAFVPDAGTERVKEFVKKFKANNAGAEPDVYAALAYDNARLLFQALRQARALDSDRVREELAGLKDFASLTGPLSFNKYQQARRAVFIVGLESGKPAKLKRYRTDD